MRNMFDSSATPLRPAQQERLPIFETGITSSTSDIDQLTTTNMKIVQLASTVAALVGVGTALSSDMEVQRKFPPGDRTVAQEWRKLSQ